MTSIIAGYLIALLDFGVIEHSKGCNVDTVSSYVEYLQEKYKYTEDSNYSYLREAVEHECIIKKK
jgi:hypothetical protein